MILKINSTIWKKTQCYGVFRTQCDSLKPVKKKACDKKQKTVCDVCYLNSQMTTLYHKNGRKIPGTESKITGKLVGRTTKRWRFYWWRHLLKLNKFHIDGQRFLQTVFDWQLHCCDFLFGGVNKAIYC